MKSLNKVELIGHVGSKYEPKKSQSGVDFISFSLATSEKKSKDSEEITQWHRMLAFGKSAEIIDRYVDKGHRIYIEGRLSYGEYVNKEGIKIKTTDIIVSNIIMLSRSENPAKEIRKHDENEHQNSFENVFDDDIPF